MAESIDHSGSNLVLPLWARPLWASTIKEGGNNRSHRRRGGAKGDSEEWNGKERERASEEPRSEPDSMPRLATGK